MSDLQMSKVSIVKRLGSVSEEKMSLIGTIAISIAISSTAVIGILAIIMSDTDFSLTKHMMFVHKYVFPLMSIVVTALYILNLLKIKEKKNSIKKIVIDHPSLIIFCLLIILILISQIYNGFGYALEGFFVIGVGETFDLELEYFIIVLFGASQVTEKKHKLFLVRFYLIVSILLAGAGFFLWITEFNLLVRIRDEGFVSIFGNRNYYGYYLAMTIPLAGSLFVYEKSKLWKGIDIAVYLINIVAISLNNCTGAWFGAFFGILFVIITFFIIEKKFNLQSIVLLIIFLVGLYVPGHLAGTFEDNFNGFGADVVSIVSGDENADDAGSGRWRIWKKSMEIINDNKLLGIGFEGPSHRKDLITVNARPHNEFMQYMLFYGIPAGLMYIVGCLGVYIRALKKRKILDGVTMACLAAAFGYLVSSFFGVTVFSVTMYLFIFLGMGYVREKTDLKEKIIAKESADHK